MRAALSANRVFELLSLLDAMSEAAQQTHGNPPDHEARHQPIECSLGWILGPLFQSLSRNSCVIEPEGEHLQRQEPLLSPEEIEFLLGRRESTHTETNKADKGQKNVTVTIVGADR